MSDVIWSNQDSFGRLSGAKERRSYQGLNEPT